MNPQQKIDELYETCVLLFEELGGKLAELRIMSMGNKLVQQKEKGDLLLPLLNTVCNTLTQKPSEVLGDRKYESIVEARFIFCKMAKDRIGASFKGIGIFLSGRNHATIINAVEQANDYIATDDEFRRKYFLCESAWLKYSETN